MIGSARVKSAPTTRMTSIGAGCGVVVTIEGLSQQFTSGPSTIAAIQDLDLSVAAGSSLAIMGPSGSGKSTLLHLIGGIQPVQRGEILVGETTLAGLRGKNLDRYRRSIGLVFQRFHLLPALTALDNVLAPVLTQRTPFDKQARGRELLDIVGLADRERAMPAQLSGGQQQRVAIARALINSPRLLLADEPTGSLDSTTGAEMMDLLMAMGQQFKTTLIVATHEEAVADRCDRVIELRDGRLSNIRYPHA